MNRIKIYSLMAMLIMALPSWGQLEFSNILVGPNTVLSITPEGEYSFFTTSKASGARVSISNSLGELIIYGDEKNLYNANDEEITTLEDYDYTKFYAFKSPDGQYIYLVQSSAIQRKGEGYTQETYLYCITNNRNPQIKKTKIFNKKNTTPVESLTCAMPHSDGKRMWIIAQEENYNTIVSYLVDGESITQKTINNLQNEITPYFSYSPSVVVPQYQRIYYNNINTNDKYYLEINTSTGEVSEPVLLYNDKQINSKKTFTICQSGEYLYTTSDNGYDRYCIKDLEKGIINKEQIYETDINYTRPQMMLGIDGNIYCRLNGTLDVIKNPDSNNPTVERNIAEGYDIFKQQGVYMAHFLSDYFFFDIKKETCSNTAKLNYYGPKAQSLHWDFGDGASSTDPSPEHAYAAPGKYTVKMTASFNNGDTKTVSKDIEVSATHKPIIKWR